MDLHREEQRQQYRLCRAAFGAIAFALGLACLSSMRDLSLQMLRMPPELRAFLRGAWWDWLVGAPITWVGLLGVYLLWGRWTDSSWQRRAGLLVVMNLVDVVLWTIEHGDALGLRTGDVGHLWFRVTLGIALGWAELALLASLAADVAVHLGRDEAAEAGVMARSCVAVGAVLFLLSFYAMTDWRHGWPLAARMPRNVGDLLAWVGWQFFFAVVLFQVTTLSIAAYRLCGLALAEMDREDRDRDPFGPRAEAFAEPLSTWPDDPRP